MDKNFIKNAEETLKALDPVLGTLITSQTLSPREIYTSYFSALCRSIVGQQVSVAAATAIFSRLEEKTGLVPTVVVTLREDDIKAIGLSKQKVSYIKDLAKHFTENPTIYAHLERQTDEQVITELTAVKGIGIWTAKMFLMFTLARPDVFAYDDVGLQRAMMRIYGWRELPPRQTLNEIAEKWSPFRTVACLHLWHSLDNSPVSPNRSS